VIFTNGLEVTGKVLRRDPAVDVALVQIPIRTRNVLPIRRELPRRLEDVYAVGSPMDEQLQASFTKGVVSGLRIDRVTGIRDIQADVPISGGNSGGPLLDRFGNVVGIAVSGIEDARAQNINFFIPIQDALDAIRVDIAPEKTVLKR
jgi:serine protease Do